jgi:hypothetical protein
MFEQILVPYCREAAIKNKNLGCGLRRQPTLGTASTQFNADLIEKQQMRELDSEKNEG